MYILSAKFKKPFNEVEKDVIENLKKEGFGILTEIDVQKTLKKKLMVDSHKYKILGACNPPFAYEALLADPDIGTLLPCNVIIREEQNEVVVSAMKPTIMKDITHNDTIAHIAKIVEQKLQRVINSL